MKKVLKKMVGLLLATMMIGSILVGSVSAAELPKAPAELAFMGVAVYDRFVLPGAAEAEELVFELEEVEVEVAERPSYVYY